MIALVTNDDGIEAEGLSALVRVAEVLFDEVWVAAPAVEASEIGHRVTTRTSIRCESRGNRRFAVHGSPADCTRVAVSSLMPRRPDWVLSGINHGGNLGLHDFFISGTVAAVREAAFAGLPGVAVSHFLRRGIEADWDSAAERTRRSIQRVMEERTEPGEFWCVNLPHPENVDHVPRVVFCEQERQSLPVRYSESEPGHWLYEGDYHSRPRHPGSDVDVCFRGDIAVSKASV